MAGVHAKHNCAAAVIQSCALITFLVKSSTPTATGDAPLQYGRARAKAFNIGESQRQTGVRFADVAGIDAIKDEIKVVMDMLLGAPEYQNIGARPFRVGAVLDTVRVWIRSRMRATGRFSVRMTGLR